MQQFDHEKLTVYQISLEFVSLAHEISDTLAAGHACLGDQLRRAAISITLNIAEGAGEFSKKEKARFYRMALRSATECAAVLDVARVIDASEEKRLDQGREMLLRIVAMSVRLVKVVGAAGAKQSRGEKEKGKGSGEGTGSGGGLGTSNRFAGWEE